MADEPTVLGGLPAGGPAPAGGAPAATPPPGGQPAAGGQPPSAAPAGTPAAATPPAAAAAPERYELKLPEKSVLDQAAVDETAAIARELGLSNDAAQKLLERRNADIAGARETAQQASEATWAGQVDKWVNDAKADKQYGGDQYESNIKIALDAVEKFASPELRKLLSDPKLGLGNHPEVIRLFWSLGKQLQPGGLVPGIGGGLPQAKTPAQVLYGAALK